MATYTAAPAPSGGSWSRAMRCAGRPDEIRRHLCGDLVPQDDDLLALLGLAAAAAAETVANALRRAST